MQRSWLGGLLFVLALAVQAILPGTAAVAHQGRQADAGFELCWKAGSQFVPLQDQGSGQPERRHAGCLICQLSNPGGTPFISTATTGDVVSCDSRRLTYSRAEPLPSRSRRENAAQARAPPQHS